MVQAVVIFRKRRDKGLKAACPRPDRLGVPLGEQLTECSQPVADPVGKAALFHRLDGGDHGLHAAGEFAGVVEALVMRGPDLMVLENPEEP